MAERPRELGDFKKARVNGVTDDLTITLLRVSHKSLRCRWQTRIIWQSNHFFYSAYLAAEYRSRPWMWSLINIAADHQIFMTLTGELSWQRLRRSAVDFYSQEALLLQRNRRNFAVQENWHFGTELNQTEVVVEAEPNPCNLYWYSAGTLRYIFPGKRKHRNLCCTCK